MKKSNIVFINQVNSEINKKLDIILDDSWAQINLSDCLHKEIEMNSIYS
jgi:hypothetical protein